MMNLHRYFLPALSPQQIELEVKLVLNFVLDRCKPLKVFSFGSAVSGKFDEMSDIDILVVFSNRADALQGQKSLYTGRPLPNRSVDFVCMGLSDFEAKKDIGGIAYVATHEGKLLVG